MENSRFLEKLKIDLLVIKQSLDVYQHKTLIYKIGAPYVQQHTIHNSQDIEQSHIHQQMNA